jgi:hypothetical protein
VHSFISSSSFHEECTFSKQINGPRKFFEHKNSSYKLHQSVLHAISGPTKLLLRLRKILLPRL